MALPPRFDVDVSLDPDPVIEAYKRHVDRTLIRENLKRTRCSTCRAGRFPSSV